MRQGDLAVEALDAKGSSSESASVQTTMKMNAEQASKSPMYLSRSSERVEDRSPEEKRA